LPATEKQTQSEQLVSAITEFVNQKYAEIKGVEDTAEHFYINKCYLCRIFKKITGLSFISYLNSIKLGHAAEILVSTNKEISEVALLCGFNSTAYFCNVFKDEFGITPRAYRVANNYY
jgi:AraC-like DNA-binding protein